MWHACFDTKRHKPEGNIPLGRPGRRLACNITTDFKEGVDLMRKAHDRDKWRAVVRTAMNPIP